ncbi:hypothetical protein BpHYR1_039598 [Brachionus plicatilis]|uniref:Uncharacterized protein n=1 Tax=Brachionus plicatilis TaxID=10195 RepID=A0A3M7QPI8_BRAPC|nr:hypothetical protein BpHYR1_039598 [Brachionus plicatilis]
MNFFFLSKKGAKKIFVQFVFEIHNTHYHFLLQYQLPLIQINFFENFVFYDIYFHNQILQNFTKNCVILHAQHEDDDEIYKVNNRSQKRNIESGAIFSIN